MSVAEQLPAAVRERVAWAVWRLNEANRLVWTNWFCCGPYHAELEEIAHAEEVKDARRDLAEFRKRAALRGVDAEAIIAEEALAYWSERGRLFNLRSL